MLIEKNTIVGFKRLSLWASMLLYATSDLWSTRLVAASGIVSVELAIGKTGGIIEKAVGDTVGRNLAPPGMYETL